MPQNTRTAPLLQADQLSFSHPAQPGAMLFDGFCLDLQAGVSWLSGDEGSGKTTLLQLLAGALPATGPRGQLRVRGISLAENRLAYRQQVAWFAPRDTALDDQTARQVFARLPALHPDCDLRALASHIEGLSLSPHLDKALYMMSTGTRRKVLLAATNLLGEENKGFYSVMKNFQTERIALAAMAVGHCTQALKMTLDHVRQRQAFGSTLFDKQVVRQRIAMLDAKVQAARAFMYHCAWCVTQKHDVTQQVSMLKALTGELAGEVVQACQQFHGGMGYMRETAIERLWRDARVLAIGGGATEVMLDEVAKRY